MVEFKRWDHSQTEKNDYPVGTAIAYIPLGEEAYGLIVVTPEGIIHLEEVPIYGGEPHYYGQYYGSVEEAVEFIKEEWK